MKINSVINNSSREPIKTFNRFNCLSEDKSLNEIPKANDANEKLVCHRVENLICKTRIKTIQDFIDEKKIK